MSNFKPKEGIAASVEYLTKQLQVLEEFIEDTQTTDNKSRSAKVFPLMLGISTAGRATLILAEARLATEFFVIARCFLERAVNYTYLMVADEKEIVNFIDHGIQKGYRATSKKRTTFNKLGRNYKIQDPNEKLEEKINKFTRRGRPTNWTPLTFRQRLDCIKDFCDDFDLSFYMNLYEDGSESVHGGFYGTLLHTGVLSEVACPTKGLQYINSYVTLSLCKLADLITVAFEATASTNEGDLSKYLQKLEHNNKTVNDFFKEMESG